MTQKSKIEWTKRTWNPLRGCSRISEGCRNCYAEQIAGRFSKPGQAFEGIAERVGGKSRFTGVISFHENILLEPLTIKKPTTFFISMSDLFHENVKDEWIDQIFAVMALCPQHTFQILTKRANRMRDKVLQLQNYNDVIGQFWLGDAIQSSFGKDLPDIYKVRVDKPLENVWLGVSVENQKAVGERIPLLLETPAAIRFLSVEPILERIYLQFADSDNADVMIDRVIVGGESGLNARPTDIQWIRSVVWQCESTNVPVFVKQLGSVTHWDGGFWAKNKDKGADFSKFLAEFPPQFHQRQFPR